MTKRQITFFATNGFYQDRQREQTFREYGRRDELYLTREGRNLVTIGDQVYDERSDTYQQQILINLDNVSDESDDLTDGDIDYGREYYQPLLNSIASIPQPQTSFFIDLDPVPWVRDTKNTHEYLKQGTNSGQIAEITPVYNYYAGRYQRLAARTDERLLPNLYSREICKTLRDDTEDNWLGSELARQDATRFCEDYDADLLPQTPDEVNPNRRIERVVFPQTELRDILALDEKKNLYPMYVNITFPTEVMGPFMRAIKKAKLSTTFYNRLLNPALQDEINLVTATGTHNGVVFSQNDYIARGLRYDNINVTTFSILDLVNNLVEEAINGDLEDAQNAEFLSLRGAERLPTDREGSCLNLLDKVYLLAVKAEIEAILETDSIPSLFDTVNPRSDIRTRTSRQDLLKETFKQEIVGYSIEKRRPNGELLGDYYFPNTDDLDILKYTDTQVRYNTEYDYEVFAHVITVAQKITDIFPINERGIQSITSTAVKDLILVKVPMFSPDLGTNDIVSGYVLPRVKLLDRPPVPPNITFIPYKDSSTDILIKAERMTDELTGNRTIPYIPMLQGDEERFIERANYQRIENFDLPEGHVEFKSEGEDANEVQVFRTTEEPQYTDDPEENTVNFIQRQAYANFATDGVYTTLTAEAGFAFTDKLKTNTKYYYTFRMRDLNGNVSNPTHIMQVEIVETEGISYPVIQEYIPTRSQPKTQKSRDLAKFIQIKPSYLGSEPLPDEQGRQIAGQAVEETPFGKHFKIRLTSKDTGRQIDLNCVFEKTVLINEENE